MTDTKHNLSFGRDPNDANTIVLRDIGVEVDIARIQLDHPMGSEIAYMIYDLLAGGSAEVCHVPPIEERN